MPLDKHHAYRAPIPAVSDGTPHLRISRGTWMSIGVSVVVCCYNSSQRLPKTLAHLACQQVSGEIPWEVLVVDNASTDDTAEVALRAWTELAQPAPLRVVRESEPGLSYARRRGFTEAACEYVSFVDDDNWVAPQWLKVVFEVMSEHATIGACGGISKAACEVKAPAWFEAFKSSYAIGAQGQEAGVVPEERGFLWGAGLTVRRSVWQELVSSGFRSLLPDFKPTDPDTALAAASAPMLTRAGSRKASKNKTGATSRA